MWTLPEKDHDLLCDLARPLVTQFAPAEEGELFELLSTAYLADPGVADGGRRGPGPLEFGWPETMVLLTPVAVAAVTEVVRFVVDAGLRRGQRVTAEAVRRILAPGDAGRVGPAGGKQVGSTAGEQPVLELTGAEWAEIRQLVERAAVRGGVPAPRAALIADAVVGRGQQGP